MRNEDRLDFDAERNSNCDSKPRWVRPQLEILPITATANAHPNNPPDSAFAPNFS